MHYGFNLKLDRRDFLVSNAVVDAHTKRVKKKVVDLQAYLMTDGNSIDADLIAKHLFPEVQCDVFISHSFADQDLAIQLAYDLKQKGVIAFVDSVVWGSSYDLLRTIDNKYSMQANGQSFSYERCNRSAAHVYMILATALQKMIMQSSTLLFLNTEHSISTKHSVQGNDKTHSSWIHMELMFSQMMAKIEQGGVIFDAIFESAAPIVHTAPTGHLKSLTSTRFVNWMKARPDSRTNKDFNRAIQSLYANPNKV